LIELIGLGRFRFIGVNPAMIDRVLLSITFKSVMFELTNLEGVTAKIFELTAAYSFEEERDVPRV
jgi:Na+-translocating ferredoxin:NAD+ oxidoreductase RnfD subunit